MSKTKPGRGIRLFKKDGSSVYIPSKKYAANVYKLGRKPAKLKWLKEKKAKKQ